MLDFGIGITTRNRPKALEVCLDHFAAFHSNESIYVIVDDSSDCHQENYDIVNKFREKVNAKVVYRFSESRLGVAKAKNACLASLQNCQDVFLFDDDCWPIQTGWSSLWSNACKEHDIHHSMYQVPLCPNPDKEPSASFSVLSAIGQGETAINFWSNCFGVALHFTRHALNILGGYDYHNAHNVYGYEHAQMSHRAKLANLTGGGHHPSPAHIVAWVYSFDINYCWRQELPPMELPSLESFRSSVTPVEVEGHVKNAPMMNTSQVFIPLEDPIPQKKVDIVIPTKSNDNDLFQLLTTLNEDPVVNQIVVIADGDQTFDRLNGRLPVPASLLSVPRSIGLHRMWNLGMDTIDSNGNHVAVINDDISLSNDSMTIVASMLNDDCHLGLVSPSDNPSFKSHLNATTAFAGFCMVMAADLAREWRFDEDMMWWYGDNDVIMWVNKTKGRVTGLTGNTHALGNRSQTINNDPPPNFYNDVLNDEKVYKRKWNQE